MHLFQYIFCNSLPPIIKKIYYILYLYIKNYIRLYIPYYYINILLYLYIRNLIYIYAQYFCYLNYMQSNIPYNQANIPFYTYIRNLKIYLSIIFLLFKLLIVPNWSLICNYILIKYNSPAKIN